MTSRRSFLIGLGSALAAPAVIRTAGLLMPVRKVISLDRLAHLRAVEAKLMDDIVYGPGFMDKASAVRAYNSSIANLHIVFAEIDRITGIDRMKALRAQMGNFEIVRA